MKRLALCLILVVTACDHWPEQHAAQCAGWLARARTPSDSLNVEMSCETIAAAHRAEQTALNMGAASIAMSASRR